MGEREGKDPLVNIALVENMVVVLVARSWLFKTKIVGQGKHSESFWQEEFPEAILWLDKQMRDH